MTGDYNTMLIFRIIINSIIIDFIICDFSYSELCAAHSREFIRE